jgi:hypothetical protein
MLLSDLLHSTVVDAGGRELGPVDDVHVVQDGPVVEGFGATLRVVGLVVGHGALGVRLGFHRTSMKGPWLLAALFRRLERRALYVPWGDVEDHDGGVVHLAKAREELGPPPPLDR